MFEYEPPTLRDRLLHPFGIMAMLVVVVAVVGYGWSWWSRRERAALEAEIEPLAAEWIELSESARPRLQRLATLATATEVAPDGSCVELEGRLEVVHAPVLTALAAGERFPRVGAPHWLASPAFRYLAGTTTPSRDPVAIRECNDTVREALRAPCIGVLDTALADTTKLGPDRTFEGGAVLGLLVVTCLDPDRIACAIPIASVPMFAISVRQRDASAQGLADDMAVSDSAQREYWDAVSAAVAKAAPRMTLARP